MRTPYDIADENSDAIDEVNIELEETLRRIANEGVSDISESGDFRVTTRVRDCLGISRAHLFKLCLLSLKRGVDDAQLICDALTDALRDAIAEAAPEFLEEKQKKSKLEMEDGWWEP